VLLDVALATALLLLVVALLAWQLTWTATRLDRLHGRVEGATAALDAALLRRATVVLELAGSGLLDPATSILLADAAHTALVATDRDREYAESSLTAVLRAGLPDEAVTALRQDPVGEQALLELADAWQRVRLARRFRSDAVSATTLVRRKRVVRWARLAGHAPQPRSFEIDDEPPAALSR
jgi:hypothetical protein